VKDLLGELLPHKAAKHQQWVETLAGEDIDTEEDVQSLSDKDFDNLPISAVLKSALRQVRPNASELAVFKTKAVATGPADDYLAAVSEDEGVGFVAVGGPVARIGATFDGGRYTIEKIMGAGGMGEVMKAKDAQLNRDVALKFPLKVDGTLRMEQEAKVLKILGKLDKKMTEHIMDLYDFKQEGSLSYMVCEYLEGHTMQQLLEEKKPNGLDEAQIVQIAIGVLKALVVIHANGFIHRDIKPSNIMWVVLPPHIKLIDFGISKSISKQENMVQTTTGSMPGSRPYMSPNAHGGQPDEHNDIWALMVSILQAAICNIPPRLWLDALVPVVELRDKGYTEPFISFIHKGLDRDPLKGFQTAAEALEEARLLPSARPKTGLTTMKKDMTTVKEHLADLLHGQGVLAEKLDDNKEILLKQGALVTSMARAFANMEASLEVVTRMNQVEMRLLEALVRIIAVELYGPVYCLLPVT
jgi:serine/threonine protein kinase